MNLSNIDNIDIFNHIKSVLRNDIQIKIKFICNWTSSQELSNTWNKMTNNGIWKNLIITTLDDYDYLIVINNPPINYPSFNKKKSILIHMEPNMERKKKVNETEWYGTIIHRNDFNVAEWHLQKTYSQLINSQFNNKIYSISGILSPKYTDIGQIKRIDFVKYLEQFVDIHIFGSQQSQDRWLWKNYKGSLPYHNKDNGLIPYKYHFNCENHFYKNYATEKIFDGILSECLVFYSGCPNIKEFIDEKAFVYLELDNFEDDINKIITAIKEDWWSQRIDIIRKEKQRILNDYNLFERLYKIINN